MNKPLLLQNGQIYSKQRVDRGDVLIRDGLIEQVGASISCPDAEAVDLCGLVVSPGFIDLHAHLREPGFPSKETVRSGTRAAAAGGFTTVCAMPNLSPVPDSLENLEAQLSIIRRDAVVEVLPYGAVTAEQSGEALADYEAMIRRCVGFSDDGKGVQRGALMREAMARIAALQGLIAAHCEDDNLKPPGGSVHEGVASRRYLTPGIPSACEARQLARDLSLVKETGARYHVCHVSARESVDLIRKAKLEGLPVTAECTPHQLFFCDEDISEDHGRFKMNPPLRGRADREAIVDGLLDGTIDCVATDHAPHTRAEKEKTLRGSLFGVVGFETAFAACHTALVVSGRMSLACFLSKMTDAPAHILGWDCGLVPGARADFTILDPAATWRVEPERFFSMGRATPFEGLTLTGQIVATWFSGRCVHDARG